MTDEPIGSRTNVRPLASVAGDGADVTVRLVETPKGERLELEAVDGDSVRLDAVALECLAWQDREAFEAFFGTLDATPVVPTGEADSGTDLTSVTNEFAHVDVRKVIAAEREFLELVAPKAGVAVTLTAPALECVSAQTQATITDLVRRRVE